MLKEERLVQDLITRFAYIKDKIRIQRIKRVFLEVSKDNFKEVFDYIVDMLKFKQLISMTGMDEVNSMGIIYHLANEDGIVLNLKMNIDREKPVIESIIKQFSSAEIYEREIADLLGITVEGLPSGIRYPLPEDWPEGQYPLRKDWKNTFK
jgi:membrane-bound hydrogenase subunit beta